VRIYNGGLKCAARGSLKIRRTIGHKNSAKSRHLRTIAQLCPAMSSQLRHISTIGENLLNNNIWATRSRNMVDLDPLKAEIGWWLWGTPANFNGFRVLASLLHRRRSTEVNQTLHDVWPSAGIVYYIYILGAVAPNRIFPHAKFTSRSSLAFSYIGSVTARHSSGVRQTNFTAMYNWRRHLYSQGGHHVGHRPTL